MILLCQVQGPWASSFVVVLSFFQTYFFCLVTVKGQRHKETLDEHAQ